MFDQADIDFFGRTIEVWKRSLPRIKKEKLIIDANIDEKQRKGFKRDYSIATRDV